MITRRVERKVEVTDGNRKDTIEERRTSTSPVEDARLGRDAENERQGKEKLEDRSMLMSPQPMAIRMARQRSALWAGVGKEGLVQGCSSRPVADDVMERARSSLVVLVVDLVGRTRCVTHDDDSEMLLRSRVASGANHAGHEFASRCLRVQYSVYRVLSRCPGHRGPVGVLSNFLLLEFR